MLPILFLTLVSAALDTKTVLHFSRKVSTCDENDRDYQNTTTKVVWSYHSQDPASEDTIPHHEHRGLKSVRFFQQEQPSSNPSDKRYFDIVQPNVTVTFKDLGYTSGTTNYFCTGHKVELSKKRHIFRVEPLLDPITFKNVHHVIVYTCPALNETDLAYQGNCESQAMPANLQSCYQGAFFHLWAVGGGVFNYPPNMAMPIGPNTTYLMFEVHYENPLATPIVDGSGFRFWYTEEYLSIEVGVLVVGQITQSIFKIPAQMPSYKVESWCPAECTSQIWPQEGLTFIGGGLHTHIAGRKLSFQHIRNGTELPPIMDEPYYDFNYQDFTLFQQDIKVLPGDTLQLTCDYDTSDRTKPTNFGPSTHDEMCLAFMIYYPRIPSENERCVSGNFTGMDAPPAANFTAFCGQSMVANWEPSPYTPYTPPACIRETPLLFNQTRQLADYANSVYLDDDEQYKLYWTMDVPRREIHAAVEVNTAGWVGFGIASEGGMVGSDVLIGWVKDGQVYVKDRFAVEQALPPIDSQQDLYNVQAAEITSSPSSAKLGPGAIAGIVIAGVVFLFFAAYLVLKLLKARNKSKVETYQGFNDERQGSEMQAQSSPPQTTINDAV